MKIALIIGGGPAGLAAAYELSKNSDIKPIIIEMDKQLGGISKTINHNGNRFDLGPHRFFSKSDRVNQLWQELLPLEDKTTNPDKSFIKVKRLTRILFLKKFFNYPVNLSVDTIKNLGFLRFIKIGFSYVKIRIKPIKEEKSLADFFTNRFGKELYLTFFKDYTEKVWGVPCEEISPDWGAQRVKSLSITKALIHFITSVVNPKANQISETSLIESFLFPSLGAGQMYEELAAKVLAQGGEIYLNQEVVKFKFNGDRVESVIIKNNDGTLKEFKADYFISTMPIKDLINGFDYPVPLEIKDVANNLVYRDYIIIALQFKKVIMSVPDNWIYIQEREAKMGRLDIINNFSLKMLSDPSNILLGAEYYCNENDEFWNKSEEELKDFAIKELSEMNIATSDDFLDYKVVRVKKAYPSYFGSYNRFSELKEFVNKFDNLFLVGRNGMHRYNNMDHSILTGLMAADNIINGISDKTNLWEVNTEEEYHEAKERVKESK